MNKTIIYYTCNKEDEKFEQAIMDDLSKKAKKANIPIISVSHKPIELGTNICIGDVPVCYTSEWKQILIGLRTAKTDFVITAESDCLYPPEYFEFTPKEKEAVYNYDNIRMVWKKHKGAYRKHGVCEGAQVCGREYWIERLEEVLPSSWENRDKWTERKMVDKMFKERKTFTGRPVVSFKTGNGVSNKTIFDVKDKLHELEYWGDVNELKKRVKII